MLINNNYKNYYTILNIINNKYNNILYNVKSININYNIMMIYFIKNFNVVNMNIK